MLVDAANPDAATDLPVITRSSAQLNLQATYCAAFPAFVERASKAGMQVVAADLTLGAWRAGEVAAAFLAQLGSDGPPIGTRRSSLSTRQTSVWSYAEVVAELIDRETAGDAQIAWALEAARIVLAALNGRSPALFVVFAPLENAPWGHENVLFLEFLTQGLAGCSSQLTLAFRSPKHVSCPDRWALTFDREPAHGQAPVFSGEALAIVPGLVPAPLIEILPPAGLKIFPLQGGLFLINPASRRCPANVSAVEFDRLAALAEAPSWLRAYAQFHGSNGHVDALFLCEEAQSQFRELGIDVALRLARRAIDCARDRRELSVAQTHAQAMRIALMRFAEVAAEPDPSRALPPLVRAFLLQCKGWGLVMSNEPLLARAYLDEACRVFPAGEMAGKEYLYLRNITALSYLRNGELEAALAIEKEITAVLERVDRPDWQLLYVNSLNTARLHRRLGAWDLAERGYRLGLATTCGVRSESDAIYANATFAKLEEQRGRPALALTYLVAAALHWLASDNPEALAGRVAFDLLGAPPVRASLVEAVSRAIRERLKSLARAVGLTVCVANSALGFSKNPRALADWACRCGPIGLLHGTEAADARFVGPEFDELRAWVSGLLFASEPALSQSSKGAILVDDRLGIELPMSGTELADVCLRRGVTVAMIAGERVNLFGGAMPQDLEACLGATIGSAIAELAEFEGETYGHFKRYRPPRRLSLAEASCLSRLAATPGTAVTALSAEGFPLELLREMETARLVNLRLDPCALAAGLPAAAVLRTWLDETDQAWRAGLSSR